VAKVRTFAKQIVFSLFHSSGIDRCCWIKSSSSPLILFAHRVADISKLGIEGYFLKDIQAQVINIDEFVRRLKVIQKFYNIVSFDEALAYTVRPGTKRIAIMTFDDNYTDFIQVAQPILQDMGIPALFFITTSALDQKELLWYDKVYSAVIGTEIPVVKMESLGGIEFPLNSLKHKRFAAVEICRLLWSKTVSKRNEIIKELIEKIGPGPLDPKTFYLSHSALTELSRENDVAIGSHTVTHPSLMLLSNKEVEAELRESKAVLESLVGYPVRHLSYPNGMADERIWKIAQRCGYESACMTKDGSPSNRYGLRRVNIGWGNFSEFSVRISGILPW
jgi:peptidoglycan/xylan/chitin deacetylase (PgdA/CDA1 family)